MFQSSYKRIEVLLGLDDGIVTIWLQGTLVRAFCTFFLTKTRFVTIELRIITSSSRMDTSQFVNPFGLFRGFYKRLGGRIRPFVRTGLYASIFRLGERISAAIPSA